MSYRFAHYRNQVPNYHYDCAGFLFYSSPINEWFIMDDFGNAIRSEFIYDSDYPEIH